MLSIYVICVGVYVIGPNTLLESMLYIDICYRDICYLRWTLQYHPPKSPVRIQSEQTVFKLCAQHITLCVALIPIITSDFNRMLLIWRRHNARRYVGFSLGRCNCNSKLRAIHTASRAAAHATWIARNPSFEVHGLQRI